MGRSEMYLMYVDESGDAGMHGSPSRYFVLSGLVLHELRWQETLERLLDFRRRMRAQFGLRMNEELHAAAMISHPGPLVRIPRNDRLAIIRHFADELASIPDITAINVVIDKSSKGPTYDPFAMAWKALIQRFENTLATRRFNGPSNPDDRGMLFPDATEEKRLVRLLRMMRRYNPIPNAHGHPAGTRNLLISKLVEDPNFRVSHDSLFTQAADLAAFLLYQHLAPNAYMRKKSGQNYLLRLDPILCKVASRTDPLGIVRL